MSVLVAIALAAAQGPAGFDPVEFFRGRTKGEGTLKVIFQSPKPVAVESVGSDDADGSLVLKQVVTEDGKPRRTPLLAAA